MVERHKKAEFESAAFPGVIIDLKESTTTVDQDELQLMDELNKKWVQAWRKEANNNCIQKMKITRRSRFYAGTHWGARQQKNLKRARSNPRLH